MDRELSEVLTFVRPLAADVGRKICAFRDSGTMPVLEKSQPSNDGKKNDMVTGADVLSEQLLRAAIRERFPDDSINGEEEGGDNRDAEWRWEIDPIDGTYNFQRGDESGISIGLLRNGKPVLGVIHFLHDHSQMYAAECVGAYSHDPVKGVDTPLSLRGKPSPADMGKSFLAWDIGHGDLETQMKVFATLRPHVRYMTSHACYPASARRVLHGQRDAYVNTGAKAFDMAASIAIAIEAGAAVGAMKGGELDLCHEGVIPSIIALNLDVLIRIQAILADREELTK